MITIAEEPFSIVSQGEIQTSLLETTLTLEEDPLGASTPPLQNDVGDGQERCLSCAALRRKLEDIAGILSEEVVRNY